MPTRSFVRLVLLCAASTAPLLNAETIAGFCRQSGSLNLLPFTLDTTTGAMQTFAALSLGPDRAGHYSASAIPDPFPGVGRRLITGIQPTGSGTTPEQFVAVDITTGIITHSATGFSNASFMGNSMAIKPGATVFELYVAQAASPAPVDKPSTNLYRYDMVTGTGGLLQNLPYEAAKAWHGSMARVFFDAAQSTLSWVLQPCTLEFPQRLMKLNVNTATYTRISFNDEFCMDSPGWFAGARLVALEIRPEGPQLVRLTTDGTITSLGGPLSGFRRAPMSPYVGSRATSHLYALNDAQTTLANWNVTTGAVSTVPVTVQSPCVRGTIMSFASAF